MLYLTLRKYIELNVLLSSFENFLLKSCSFNLSKVLLLIERTMIKVLNISHSRRNLENTKNIKMCQDFWSRWYKESDLTILSDILLMLYETKWDPDSQCKAKRREKRVEVRVAHYIIKLVIRVKLKFIFKNLIKAILLRLFLVFL